MFDEVLVFTFERFFCNLIYIETYRAMQELIFSLLLLHGSWPTHVYSFVLGEANDIEGNSLL